MNITQPGIKATMYSLPITADLPKSTSVLIPKGYVVSIFSCENANIKLESLAWDASTWGKVVDPEGNEISAMAVNWPVYCHLLSDGANLRVRNASVTTDYWFKYYFWTIF